MRHLIAILVVLCGCENQNEIRLLLGPDPNTLTVGFLCRRDTNQDGVLDEYVFADAYNAATGKLEFQLIVDLIGFGGRAPGCRGEELYAACDMPPKETCEVLALPGGARRFCRRVELARTLLGDPKAVRAELERQLAGTIVSDAPDIPIAIRAVATTEPCTDQLLEPVGGTYALLDTTAVVGCAYSCPLLLDAVDRFVSLSSDSPDDACEDEIRLCAGFPRLP